MSNDMKRGLSYWLKVLAVISLLIMTGILLLFAISDSAGGNYTGLYRAGPAMAGIGLVWLGWRYPSTAGWVSLALGILAFLRYGVITSQPLGEEVLIMSVPPAISGVLFLIASRFEAKNDAAQEVQKETEDS
jgi:hypothetical protein